MPDELTCFVFGFVDSCLNFKARILQDDERVLITAISHLVEVSVHDFMFAPEDDFMLGYDKALRMLIGKDDFTDHLFLFLVELD